MSVQATSTSVYVCDACGKTIEAIEYARNTEWRSSFYYRNSPNYIYHAYLTACSRECHDRLGSCSDTLDEHVPASIKTKWAETVKKLRLDIPTKPEPS